MATVVDSLVTDHLSLVTREARRIARKPDAQEELEGWGALGLMEAAHRWDPTLGVPFGAYARQRIRGAMLDAARRWFLGPRGRPVGVVSIEGVDIAVDDAYEDADERAIVYDALMELPEREREIIVRVYWEGVTMTQIAEDWGVTIAWISTLHRRALDQLREVMS